MTKCEVCNERDGIAVAAVPGVPYSAAYCAQCAAAGAIPWWIAVANTAAVGGYDMSAPWWQEVVDTTIVYLGKTRQQLNEEVAEEIEARNLYESAQEAAWEEEE